MKRLLSGMIILLLLLSGCGTKAGGTENPPAISTPPAQNAPETPPAQSPPEVPPAQSTPETPPAQNTPQQPAEPVPPAQPELPEPAPEEIYLDWTGTSTGIWPFEFTAETLAFRGSDAPELIAANEAMQIAAEDEARYYEEACAKGEAVCRQEYLTWASMWSYPVTTERYITAIIVQRRHMQFRIDETCTWDRIAENYVYDKEEKRLISLEEAMTLAGVTQGDLERAILQYVSRQGIGTYEKLNSIGFYMDPEGQLVFIIGATVYGHGPSVGWPTFFNWDNGEVRWPGDEPLPLGLVDTDWDELACLQSLKQYDGTAMISESEALETLREIVEVQDALLLGMKLKNDGTTVMIGGELHMCIGLGMYRDTGFAAERLYAVSWNSVYVMDPRLNDWVPVAFG